MVAGAVSQFTETVNMPTAGKANRGNENVVPFHVCRFYTFFIATKPPEFMPTYPQPANPKEGSWDLIIDEGI